MVCYNMSKDTVKITISSSDEEFQSLNDVFTSGSLRAGDTIILYSDVTVGDPITITKRCTIDLNSHYIFVVVPAGIIVKDRAAVTFINGKIQTASTEQIEDAIISQGSNTSVTLGEGLEVIGRGTAIHARKRGSLIIDGATISSTGSQPTIYVDDSTSSLTIHSGIISSVLTSAIAVRDGATALIESGTISTEADDKIPEFAHPAIAVSGLDSKITMSGGTIYSANTSSVSISAASTLEVTGGTIHNESYDYPVIEVAEGYSSFLMSGGHVYATRTAAILSNKMNYGDVQTIHVSGGKVGAKGSVVLIAGPGDHGIEFSGGAVKGDLPQKYISIGHGLSGEPDADGYYEIIVKTPSTDDDTGSGDNPFFPISEPEIIDEDGFSPENPNLMFTSDMLPDPIVPDIPCIPEIETPPVPEGPCLPDVPVGPSDPEKPDKPEIPDKPPIILPEVSSYSVYIKNRIYIYNTPSRTHKITEWRGALTVFDEVFFSADNEEFVSVKFRIPGSGRLTSGYVLLHDILNA